MLHIIMAFGCVGIQNFGVTPKFCSYPHNALFRRALESHEDAFSLNRLVQGQAPHQPKVRRVDDRRPYTFITLQPNTVDGEAIVLRALLDSGASSTIVAKNILQGF